MQRVIIPILLSLMLIAFGTTGILIFSHKGVKKTTSSSTTRRVIRPLYGVNTSNKYIRDVDTLFSVGDTILLDLRGISFDNECIILK